LEKIKNIEISNFKSIKHLKIEGCNKINVFIGQPNAGKSNILEALGLYGMTVSNKPNLNDFVRFRNASELFFEGNITDKIEIEINKSLLTLIEKDYSNESDFDPNDYINFSASNDLKVKREIYKSESNGVKSVKKYQFRDVEFEVQNNQKNLDFPLGKNLAQVIISNPKIRNRVNELFRENDLKLLIDKGNNELKIFKEYQDGVVFILSYELIADTLQRLIFYKAAIMSNEKSILLFEEPEAHCFEPYILEFTNDVKYDKNDNQFFIVTHSDFIIQEFLRDEESKQNTNIYLVNNVDGETKVKFLDKKKNDDVYEYGMNAFFNFESLWENN